MTRIGLIVNPIAGLGGSVGLKGTDGMEEEAWRLGAKPLSNERTATALLELSDIKDGIVICTGSGALGQDVANELGFMTEITHYSTGPTSSVDTITLARNLVKSNVSLILFSGGDGTAVDIYRAIGNTVTVIGIPAGVKIYSPVYAKTPGAAGAFAKLFILGKVKGVIEAEVLDIDENLYREGQVDVILRGYLSVPEDNRFLQGRKTSSPLSEAAAIDSIAGVVIRSMEMDTYYLIGAGTTTRRIMECLELENTLIGVDLIYNKELVAKDVYGQNILDIVKDKPLKLVITVTGGQGFLFGRGNQQLTPNVLRKIGKENIIIIATQKKLASLGGQSLLLDTGDNSLNAMLSGYYKIITAYNQVVVAKVE